MSQLSGEALYLQFQQNSEKEIHQIHLAKNDLLRTDFLGLREKSSEMGSSLEGSHLGYSNQGGSLAESDRAKMNQMRLPGSIGSSSSVRRMEGPKSENEKGLKAHGYSSLIPDGSEATNLLQIETIAPSPPHSSKMMTRLSKARQIEARKQKEYIVKHNIIKPFFPGSIIKLLPAEKIPKSLKHRKAIGPLDLSVLKVSHFTQEIDKFSPQQVKLESQIPEVISDEEPDRRIEAPFKSQNSIQNPSFAQKDEQINQNQSDRDLAPVNNSPSNSQTKKSSEDIKTEFASPPKDNSNLGLEDETLKAMKVIFEVDSVEFKELYQECGNNIESMRKALIRNHILNVL